MPYGIRTMERNAAIDLLVHTGQNIVQIANTVTPDKAAKPTLIPRPMSLEDSSRNWSIIMTIEHLLITGVAMQEITEQLSSGICPTKIVRIEDVKPRPGQSPDNILKDYLNFLNQYEESIGKLGDLNNQEFKHEHPWFGALTAHDWLALNAAHHRLQPSDGAALPP